MYSTALADWAIDDGQENSNNVISIIYLTVYFIIMEIICLLSPKLHNNFSLIMSHAS